MAEQTLTAEAILGAKDFKEMLVEMPEWGGAVKVRTLSMGARYEISANARDAKGARDNTAMAISTLVHGVVEPKLTREQAQQIVATKPLETVDKVLDAVWRLSGILEGEAAKN